MNDDDHAYDSVWRAAAPYLRVRKNDVHVPIAYDFARRLLRHYPQADEDVVSIAILLHDIGWYAVDKDDIFSKAFGPGGMQSDTFYLHEREGVRMARELLGGLGYGKGLIEAVATIIDGHDTRAKSRSLNDSLVRDADRLWRFTLTGVAISCDWFKMTPARYIQQLRSKTIHLLETEVARDMARMEVDATAAVLKVDVL